MESIPIPTIADLTKARARETGNNWGNTLVDRQEPQPLHIVLEKWLRGHPLEWKYIENKMDIAIDEEHRLPIAILTVLWTARKNERVTGNPVVDKANRWLEMAARNRGG